MTLRKFGWSRDDDTWQVLADTSLAFDDWGSQPFGKAWRDHVPRAPGLYVVTGSPPITGPFSEAWCPLYVGQTSNLWSRFGDHLRGGTSVQSLSIFKRLIFYYLRLPADTADSRQLRCYEQLLINAFGPIANEKNAIRQFAVGKPIPL